MSPIKLVDEWIMGRIFDPLSWHIEERFGYNNFDLARLVLPMWPITVLVATLTGLYQYSSVTLVFSIFMCGMLYVQSFRHQSVQKKGFQNVLRIHPATPYLRIGVMIALLIELWIHRVGSLEWFNIVSFTPFWVHYCFMACNGMPPEFRERHREFAHNLV